MATPQASSHSRRRVLVLANFEKPQIARRAEAILPILEKYFDIVATIDGFSAKLPTDAADLAVVLGGDGSILRAAHAMEYEQLPVIGINLGRLGFLAAVQPEQLEHVLPLIARGHYTVVSHLMFECDVERPSDEPLNVLGLNEVAVLAGPPFSVLEVQLYVDGGLVTTYSCDGLIVSTPVGSTAHSLSAGGPILQKSLQALVISPISAHTLTNRPVVDSADRMYELRVPDPHEGTTLVVDGKVICQLTAEDRVQITRSKAQFQLVEVRGHGYYRTLREKLGWGGQLTTDEC